MLIAHFSDPHLCRAGTLYQSVLNTHHRFEQTLAASGAFAPDLVIVSGDLTEHGDPLEYSLACTVLGRFACPVLVIPGNHDDREAFRSLLFNIPTLVPLTSSGPLHAVAEDGPVRVLGLDVTVPGEHHGQMVAAHADWLDTTLAQAPDTPTLVMMHQPPFLTGMDYIDAYRCFGEDLLADVLARHPQVIRVLAGHVHRHMVTTFASRPAMTAPSTATSLALRLTPGAEPASFTEPPAMLLHHWRDGQLTSHLHPVGDWPGPYDFF